jgi:hypothetical protein
VAKTDFGILLSITDFLAATAWLQIRKNNMYCLALAVVPPYVGFFAVIVARPMKSEDSLLW